MKVLLDENLPHRLRQALHMHEARTTAFMGWVGITNGELLGLAEDAGFNVFVTADRNVEDQLTLPDGKLLEYV